MGEIVTFPGITLTELTTAISTNRQNSAALSRACDWRVPGSEFASHLRELVVMSLGEQQSQADFKAAAEQIRTRIVGVRSASRTRVSEFLDDLTVDHIPEYEASRNQSFIRRLNLRLPRTQQAKGVGIIFGRRSTAEMSQISKVVYLVRADGAIVPDPSKLFPADISPTLTLTF